MVKVGIVGYGYAGRCFHAYLVKRAPGLQLRAIVSSRPEKREAATREHGVETFGCLDDLLEDGDVDVVVIATPHDTHADLSIRAMEAGKHVVTDKIMCMTTEEADRMIEARDRNGVMLSVFHNRRWDGDFMTVKRAIKSGLLGKVFLIHSSVTGYGKPRGWRCQRQRCGGQLSDWGAHLIDQALLISGTQITRLACWQHHVKWEMDADSHCRLLLEFQDGPDFEIELSRVSRIPKPRWFVFGEEGTLEKYGVDPQERAMLAGDIARASDPEENWATLRTEVSGVETTMRLRTVPGTWDAFYMNISDHLNKGAPLAVTAEEARRVVKVVELAELSAQGYGEVKDVELE